jgi:N-acetylneuraminic acid mutarotase
MDPELPKNQTQQVYMDPGLAKNWTQQVYMNLDQIWWFRV